MAILPVVVWSTAKGNDQWNDDKANDHTYLDARQPKLKFAKNTDSEVVDENYQGQENRNPNTGIDCVAVDPVPKRSASSDLGLLNHQRSSGKSRLACFPQNEEAVLIWSAC